MPVSYTHLDVYKRQINGNATTKNVIAVCDHKQGDYAAKRILDKKILELNAEGYLNGHIPDVYKRQE